MLVDDGGEQQGELDDQITSLIAVLHQGHPLSNHTLLVARTEGQEEEDGCRLREAERDAHLTTSVMGTLTVFPSSVVTLTAPPVRGWEQHRVVELLITLATLYKNRTVVTLLNQYSLYNFNY